MQSMLQILPSENTPQCHYNGNGGCFRGISRSGNFVVGASAGQRSGHSDSRSGRACAIDRLQEHGIAREDVKRILEALNLSLAWYLWYSGCWNLWGAHFPDSAGFPDFPSLLRSATWQRRGGSIPTSGRWTGTLVHSTSPAGESHVATKSATAIVRSNPFPPVPLQTRL